MTDSLTQNISPKNKWCRDVHVNIILSDDRMMSDVTCFNSSTV